MSVNVSSSVPSLCVGNRENLEKHANLIVTNRLWNTHQPITGKHF